MFKFKKFFIVLIFFIFVGLLNASNPKVYAGGDEVAKATSGVLVGWTETVVYPMQEAAKAGWLGKIMFPVNVGLGAVKGAVREVAGAIDLVTFFKGKNIVDSWPGEEL